MVTLKKYHLASDGGLNTRCYDLVFDDDGSMYVLVTVDYEQPYKKDMATRLDPADFRNYTVDGTPLVNIVTKKLLEILPEPH